MYGFYSIPVAFKDKVVPSVLLEGRVYEPRTINLIRNWTGNGSIVSGGAFVGDFFPAISRSLQPGRRLISFEPNPISYDAALEAIAINQLNNVVIHPIAVGETEGDVDFQIEREDGPTAAQAKIIDHTITGKTISTPMRTLDSIVDLNELITVLHLDIEGHEIPAIKGARQLISLHKPLVIVEGANSRRISEYVEALDTVAGLGGYRHVGTMERNSFFLPISSAPSSGR